MGKKGITLILFVIGIILYYIQRNIFSNLLIFNVAPNILIIYILFLGLYTNSKVSMIIGIMLGFLLDTVYGKCIGVSSIMFCILAYLVSYFDKNFSKDNKVTIILMIIGATIVYEFGYYLISSFILKYEIEIWYFLKINLIENIYNVLLVILFYPLMQKIGYIIDRKYKKSNLLTRYF